MRLPPRPVFLPVFQRLFYLYFPFLESVSPHCMSCELRESRELSFTHSRVPSAVSVPVRGGSSVRFCSPTLPAPTPTSRGTRPRPFLPTPAAALEILPTAASFPLHYWVISTHVLTCKYTAISPLLRKPNQTKKQQQPKNSDCSFQATLGSCM